MPENQTIEEKMQIFFRDIAFCIRCGQGGSDNFVFIRDTADFAHYDCKRCGRKLIVSHEALERGTI